MEISSLIKRARSKLQKVLRSNGFALQIWSIHHSHRLCLLLPSIVIVRDCYFPRCLPDLLQRHQTPHRDLLSKTDFQWRSGGRTKGSPNAHLPSLVHTVSGMKTGLKHQNHYCFPGVLFCHLNTPQGSPNPGTGSHLVANHLSIPPLSPIQTLHDVLEAVGARI